jgi:hypothetical protein
MDSFKFTLDHKEHKSIASFLTLVIRINYTGLIYYKLLAIIVSSIIASAIPQVNSITAHQATRAGHNHLSHLNMPVNSSKAEMNGVPGRTNADYSLNWSSAVLKAPPSGTIFTSVSAEFTVPTPRHANNKAGFSSAWVNIDRNIYQNAILQTGIDFTVTLDGSISFDAWYEWYPDYAHDFSDISIRAGDRISLSVISTSPKSGTVTIKNLTNSQTLSQSLTAPDFSSILAGQNAEWIIKDYKEGNKLVTLNNFGIIAFNNVLAGLSDGSSVGADGANIINIRQNGQVLTSVIATTLNVIIVSQTEREILRTIPEKDKIKLEY